MAKSIRICPICDTANHTSATVCVVCGSTLAGVEKKQPNIPNEPAQVSQGFDYRYGETDLAEGKVSPRARLTLYGILATMGLLAILLCIGGILLAWQTMQTTMLPPTATEAQNKNLVINLADPVNDAIAPTVTRGAPTLTPSITPLPSDTPTITPTPLPCTRVVEPDDTLLSIVLNCGHRDQDILQEVREINNLVDDNVPLGQTIFVPWPTATGAPVPEETEETGASEDPNGASNESGLSLEKEPQLVSASDIDAALEEFDPFAEPPTPTLPPGIQWHTVGTGEDLITIIDRYEANMKVLSELNPEVDFNQCEFGDTYGGPECNVIIYPGQLLRVPAPTPTPTLSPTPNGSETPTPRPTATFNQPSIESPTDRAFFQADELITLRWVPSGTLSANQYYWIEFENLNTGEIYNATTKDIFYLIPIEWQGTDTERHTYRWAVGIVVEDDIENPFRMTESRTVIWQGSGEESGA